MKKSGKEVWQHGSKAIAFGCKSFVHFRMFAWGLSGLFAKNRLVKWLSMLTLRVFVGEGIKDAFSLILEIINDWLN